MTRISISDLQGQNTETLVPCFKDEANGLVDTAISRALDARKISGGILFPPPTIGLIYVDPKVSGM
jgi:hypothetical protein